MLVHDGRELPLIPRCFDLLVLLIERRDEAVSRNDILDAVWSDVVVSDGALSQASGRSDARWLTTRAIRPLFARSRGTATALSATTSSKSRMWGL